MKKQIQTLQNAYAAVLADAVASLTRHGLLEKVTVEKSQTRTETGKMQVGLFDVKSEQDVFLRLVEIFGCADWKITDTESGFEARAEKCKLCAMTKRMGGGSPCDIYCLNPIKGMLKNINPDAEFITLKTLYDNDCCKVKVKLSHD